jgi:hypothetical protein
MPARSVAPRSKHRLDDLHPGGRDHPAEQHVEQHDAADDQHRRPIRQTEQEVDEPAGADHLRDQVEADHGQVPLAAAMRTGRWLRR